MATQAQHRPQVNGAMPRKSAAPRAQPAKRPAAARQMPNGASKQAAQRASPAAKKAYSVAGEMPTAGPTSAYAIMASRIANRVAEMAESITFVERAKPQEQQQQYSEPAPEEKKRPRKLEMRLGENSKDSVAFSAPFLDNTLQKMLQLQNRMLQTTADLSKAEGVQESVIKEHANQSAELSRIIAMICAEKARQGA